MDRNNWFEKVTSRRDDVGEVLVREFIDRCVRYGALPGYDEQDDFSIVWADLFSPSERQKADIAATYVTVIAQYVKSGADDIIPLEVFCRRYLHLEDSVIDKILAYEKEREEEANPDDDDLNVGEDGNDVPVGEVIAANA